MNVVTRGIRNAFRNTIRTFSIVLILGLSIGLALAMLVARASVEDKITSVKSSIGNTITLSPSGARGFQGGGEPLTVDQLKTVASIAHVTKVAESLDDRLTSDNTNLASAIEAGTLGNRSAGNSGVGFRAETGGGFQRREDSSESPQITRTFTPPVLVTGVTDVSSSSVYGGDTVSFTSGQAFDASKDEDVAVLGKALAEKNNLAVGSTFTAYGKDVKVVGIFDAGNTFANNGVFMQLSTLQRLSGQTNNVSTATVAVDSLDNVDAATKAISAALGDKADVTNSLDTAKQAVDPLESVKTISTFSLVGAIAAGAAIILLTMVMIVRERRREIGVFKAIGASNLKVMLQFMSEAVTLTILALMAGLIIGAVAANPVTKVLVNNSTSSSSSAQPNEPPAGGAVTFQSSGSNATSGGEARTFRGGPAVLRSFGNNTVANAKNVQAKVGTSILLYGVATAFIIAIVGSAIPAFLISKIRPADVMRAE
jgi:putative ABC transport system permease protein